MEPKPHASVSMTWEPQISSSAKRRRITCASSGTLRFSEVRSVALGPRVAQNRGPVKGDATAAFLAGPTLLSQGQGRVGLEEKGRL